MERSWVTCGTPTMPGILNPLLAACDRGYVPDEVRVLTNPDVAETVAEACEHVAVVIDNYHGSAAVEQEELVEETDFEAIGQYFRSAIRDARENDATVAVDITPGRKFMSAIAFQAGIQFDADHVYYFHRKGGVYQGEFYPEIPRTATDLIDFSEVI
jgi:predicted RNase H-like HicB family nuclease